MNKEKPVFKFALTADTDGDKQFLPRRSEEFATGWDVRACLPNKEALVIKPFEQIKLSLGFRAFCPEGWWFKVNPRSSSFFKKNAHFLYGVVDTNYENTVCAIAQYIPQMKLDNLQISNVEINTDKYNHSVFDSASFQNLIIKHGEPIAQLIPVLREEMEVVEVSNEEYDIMCKERGGSRGTKGFGQTGG